MSTGNIFLDALIMTLVIAWVACLIQLAAINGSLGKFGHLTIGHNHKYCKYFDEYVNKCLDNVSSGNASASSNGYYLSIGDSKFWIGNKFYGYCSKAITPGSSGFRGVRASYRTAMRLYKLEMYLAANGPIEEVEK